MQSQKNITSIQLLKESIGNMDIYLLDQLLKDQFSPNVKILDAGCGNGRNVEYFIKAGFEVFGVDVNEGEIATLKSWVEKINPFMADNFKPGRVEALPFKDRTFDVVISSAVLHFAEDEIHFDRMLKEMWRVLKYGGFLFCRLASDVGIEEKVISLGNRRYRLPDGSERFLINEDFLSNYTIELNGILMEPIKTVVIQGTRSMTNWLISKVI